MTRAERDAVLVKTRKWTEGDPSVSADAGDIVLVLLAVVDIERAEHDALVDELRELITKETTRRGGS